MPFVNRLIPLTACLEIIFLLPASPIQAEVVTIDVTVKAIDAKERSITVTKMSKTKSKDIELEVGKKAKIVIDGKDAALDAVKAGQKASVSYESDLEVVTRIEVGENGTPTEANNSAAEILNIEELNTVDDEFSPWLSDDGMTIYWDAINRTKGKVDEAWLWTAQRADAESQFGNKEAIFRGRFPVLPADGLEIVFRSPDFDGLSVATRKNSTDSFGRPRQISEIKVAGLNARPRCISHDGLSLYFDRNEPVGKKDNTWVSTRSSPTEKWQAPKPLDVRIKGMVKDSRFTQVFLTADGLHLFGVATLPRQEGKGDVGLGVLSRTSTHGPFTEYHPFTLQPESSESRSGYVPRFVEATNELFLISGALHTDPSLQSKRKFDLWVVKNFSPPYPKP